MDWNFRSDQPIYTQLTQRLSEAIAAGVFAPGERLPTVRELAMEAGVNPNTVQRALAELERQGLVFSQRTAGRFVTEEEYRITNARNRLADERVERFLRSMRTLGCDKREVLARIASAKEDDNYEYSGM